MSNRKKVKDPTKTPRSQVIKSMKQTLAELDLAEKALLEREERDGQG